MIIYLIKSAGYAVLFLLVYRFILEKEKMHFFNRVYLLVSVVLSLAAPMISIPVEQDSLQSIDGVVPDILLTVATRQTVTIENAGTLAVKTDYTMPGLWMAYAIITSVLLIRFVTKLHTFYRATHNHPSQLNNGIRFVITDNHISSFTFLNTIFISPADLGNKEIREHEQAHVRQKHSLDILFIELVTILFWFNPVYIFYKRAIQLNHEFLADEAVVRGCADIPTYQHLLLDRITLISPVTLGSRFNYSITKKRLLMMTHSTSPGMRALKKLTASCIAATALVIFGTKITAQQKPYPLTAQGQKDTGRTKPPPSVVPTDLIYGKIPYTEQGVSQEMMDEYNTIIKKNMTKHEKGFDIMAKPEQGERERMEAIFKQMNKAQQQSVHVVFLRKIKAFEKQVPTAKQMETWKNPSLYGVWINEKKVNNQSLNQYNASDFSHYFASKLYGAAKKNVTYQVQLNLMTNAYYEKYYKDYERRPEFEMYYRHEKGKLWFAYIG